MALITQHLFVMRPCVMGRTVDCNTIMWTAVSEIAVACLKSPSPVGCRTTARFIPLDTNNTAPVVRSDYFARAISAPTECPISIGAASAARINA